MGAAEADDDDGEEFKFEWPSDETWNSYDDNDDDIQAKMEFNENDAKNADIYRVGQKSHYRSVGGSKIIELANEFKFRKANKNEKCLRVYYKGTKTKGEIMVKVDGSVEIPQKNIELH